MANPPSNSGGNLPGPKSSFSDRIAKDAGKSLGRHLAGPTGQINRKRASSLPPKPSRQQVLEDGWTGEETLASTVKAGPKWFRLTVRLVAGVVVTGLISAVAYGFLRKRPAPIEVVPQAPPERSLATQMLSAKAEAERVVRGFFTARTPAEKAPWVRGGTAMLPAMERFYAAHPDEPDLPPDAVIFDAGASKVVAELDRDGRALLQTTIRDAAGTPHACLMERRPEGLRLDWRAYHGLGDGDRTLPEIIAAAPAEPVLVRAVVTAGNQSSARFPDPSRHQACLVTDYANVTRVPAFIERSTPVWTQVNDAFQKKFTALRANRPSTAVSPPKSSVISTGLPEPEGATVEKPVVLLPATVKIRIFPANDRGEPAEVEIVEAVGMDGWLDNSLESGNAAPEAPSR